REPLRLLDPLFRQPAVERRIAVHDLVDVEERLPVAGNEEEPHRWSLSRGRLLTARRPARAHRRSRPHAPDVFSAQARPKRDDGRARRLNPCLRGNNQWSAAAPTAQTTT